MRRSIASLFVAPFVVPFVLLCGCGGGPAVIPDAGGDGAVVNTGCPNGQVKFEDVCLNMPSKEATRTQCGDVTEYCDTTGTKTPNLSCLTAPTVTLPATPALVTLTGFVHPFSNGNKNSPSDIQIFKASDLADGTDIKQVKPIAVTTVTFDPSTATDPTLFRACDVLATVGCVAVSPAACHPPNAATCNDGLPGGTTPDQGLYCHLVNNVPTCSSRLRWEPRFSIAGVPTNTALVIRTSGAMEDTTIWGVIAQWNVFLSTKSAPCTDPQQVNCLDLTDPVNPKYQFNVNVISQSDYYNIASTAGLSTGISAGEGAVAGEIHDCDDVRIENAEVGVKMSGDKFTYFNGNPYMTLPDGVRAGTDQLGLYASLNNNPGKIVVESVGLVGGAQTSLGSYTAFVYPSTVSVVNVNGGKPVQQAQ